MSPVLQLAIQGAAVAAFAWSAIAGLRIGVTVPVDREAAFGEMRRWIWVGVALLLIGALGRSNAALDPQRTAPLFTTAQTREAVGTTSFSLFCRRLSEADQARQETDPELIRRLLAAAYTPDGRIVAAANLATGANPSARPERIQRTLLSVRQVDHPSGILYEVEMIVRRTSGHATTVVAPASAARSASRARATRAHGQASHSGPPPTPLYQQVNYLLRPEPYLKIDQEVVVVQRPAHAADLARERELLANGDGPLCQSGA